MLARSLLRLLISCGCLLPLHAQSPPDVQRLVEQLYPKNERLKQIRLADVVRQLDIHAGSRVADVGCGPGEFSIILSRVVGRAGAVYCEDIDPGKPWGLRAARANARRYHAGNIVLIHGTPDSPNLPAGQLDAVMIVNAYHEMVHYQAMLQRIRESLKPGGRLVIMDNRPRRTAARPREKQTNNHVLSADLAASELEAAGFRIVARDDAFIDDPDSESANWLITSVAPWTILREKW
jgi:ubiquinone/menaquinone biosynthesis C-methylase UbiE